MNDILKPRTIVFIGAGNLATHLAGALYKHGYHIGQVYSRTIEAARTLANKIDATYTNQLADVVNDADLYIISLTDSAFLELLPQIVANKNKNALFVHTAGTVSVDVWKGYVSNYGVFYPMQTFSKQREVDFSVIPIFIESNNAENTKMLLTMASAISSNVHQATSDQRKKLHVAAVFACNFANHMYALTAELLEKNNLSFDVMLPLIEETAGKVKTLHPFDAQTGPAKRNDEAVMNEHLKMLAQQPELAKIYQDLSKSILEHHTNK